MSDPYYDAAGRLRNWEKIPGRHVDTTRKVDTPAPCQAEHWRYWGGPGGAHRKPGPAK